MAKFTDHTGHEWKLLLTYGSAKRVKDVTGVNLALAGAGNTEWVNLIFDDPGKLVGILWELCEEQAKAANVTAEQFGERFDGTTLSVAGDALLEAVADFFPRSRIAQALREKIPVALAKAEAEAVARLERLTASNSVSEPPVSSESIPTG
jgi:hypothetical protein